MSNRLPFREQLTLRDNLHWAWNKAKALYKRGDIWYDEPALAAFEANLESELDSITRQFETLHYKMSPIRPLAHPKAAKNGRSETRQAFSITVRDQVAWIAFVNIIGPLIDVQMPPWSYGNRLYRSTWYRETALGKETFEVGWYRHSNGQLYRKFHQSWPIFRRHVLLTVREMTKNHVKFAIDETNQKLLETEETLKESLKIPYLKTNYWPAPGQDVYWASVDLTKFYPSVPTDLILQNLVTFSGFEAEKDEIATLASQLLTFRLNTDGWEDEELDRLSLQRQKFFSFLPTGLFVAGFLANVALLQADKAVSQRLNGNIAHFRYVDDHIVLATSFDQLVQWLEWYQITLKQLSTHISFNKEKVHPKELGEFLRAREARCAEETPTPDLKQTAERASKLDPKFPAPLMTQTLELVSDIARIDFDRLSDREQRHILDDLQHLFLTEFPDNELREDTRIAFAATMISRLAPRAGQSIEGPARLARDVFHTKQALKKKRAKDPAFESAEILDLQSKLTNLEKELKITTEAYLDSSQQEQDRIYSLLLKGLHEHPEKLRLWARTLDYCRRIGRGNLSKLGEELQLLAQSNPITTSYLRALVWQATASHCIDCAKAIYSETATTKWKRISATHLSAVASLFKSLDNEPRQLFYEKSSKNLLQCALGTALLFLNRTTDAGSGVQARIQELIDAGALNWIDDAVSWASTTDQPLPAWLWWAETKLSNKLSVMPTPLWKNVAEVLDPIVPQSWSVWARYPQSLSPEILNRMAEPPPEIRKLYFSRNDTGWLYEVIKNSSLSPALKSQWGTDVTARVIKAAAKKAPRITLDDWAKWAWEHSKENPHDPRISEWTALQIILAIAKQRTDFRKIKSKKVSIHPANFTLPQKWINEPGKTLSWEKWKLQFKEKLIEQRYEFQIIDSRFCRSAGKEQEPAMDREPVRGLGLLLLGLLRRSFDWPAIWNPRGHQQAWAGIARSLISNVPCSSWTTGIIEACLIPKVTESLLFPLLHNQEPLDTIYDPPPINSLSELIPALETASKVLADYQLSVWAHEARQLVPVNLQQLTRPNWAEDFDNSAST